MTEHNDAESFRRALTEAAGSAIWLKDNSQPGGGRYIHIVESWEQLAGPAHGTVAVPGPLADYEGEIADLDRLDTSSADAAAPTDLLRLYHRVINRGSAQQQQTILNPDLLVLNWTERIAELPVRELWEQRFPQLRG